MAMFGYCPVWLKIAMACVMAELLTLSISLWIALVFAFIADSSAVTFAICC